MALGGGRELRVILTSDVDKFRRGLRTAESDARGWSKRIGKAVGIGLAGAAAAAGTFAAKFATDGVQAFIDDEAAAGKLTQTLKNLGKAQDNTRVEDYIDKLSTATGVADDELRPAFEKLVGATGDTDEAMRLLSGAVDASAGSGKDLAGVADAISKAVGKGGTLGALRRLIPGLDTTKTKAGDAESVLKTLNSRFSGQAAARMDTYAGKAQAIGTAFSELEESFGRGLLGDTENLNSAFGDLDSILYDMQPRMETLGSTLAQMAGLASTFASIAQAFQDMNDSIPDWAQSAIETGLKNVPGLGAALSGQDLLAQAAAAQKAIAGGQAVHASSAGGAFPQLSSAAWDPNIYALRVRDATNRADSRSAQKSTKTRARP